MIKRLSRAIPGCSRYPFSSARLVKPVKGMKWLTHWQSGQLSWVSSVVITMRVWEFLDGQMWSGWMALCWSALAELCVFGFPSWERHFKPLTEDNIWWKNSRVLRIYLAAVLLIEETGQRISRSGRFVRNIHQLWVRIQDLFWCGSWTLRESFSKRSWHPVLRVNSLNPQILEMLVSREYLKEKSRMTCTVLALWRPTNSDVVLEIVSSWVWL